MFAKLLKAALDAPSPKLKCDLVRQLCDIEFSQADLDYIPEPISQQPSYSSFLTITHPTRIRRPKALNSEQALARTLHQIAHIEYSAIDLALDSAYRFKLDRSYTKNWLKVALEEVEHFSAIASALNELGFNYGDFAVHAKLHEASVATASSLKIRMGVVHRWLEACGLDANPFVAQKVLASKFANPKLLKPLLAKILQDELGHVSFGHQYYLAAGGKVGLPFVNLLLEYSELLGKSGWLNYEARMQAGYDQTELDLLQNHLARRD